MLVKFGQDNRISLHRHICYPINKSLEAIYLYIPIAACTLSSGNYRLVSSPLPDIVKLPMYDGLFIIVPIEDKGSRTSMN